MIPSSHIEFNNIVKCLQAGVSPADISSKFGVTRADVRKLRDTLEESGKLAPVDPVHAAKLKLDETERARAELEGELSDTVLAIQNALRMRNPAEAADLRKSERAIREQVAAITIECLFARADLYDVEAREAEKSTPALTEKIHVHFDELGKLELARKGIETEIQRARAQWMGAKNAVAAARHTISNRREAAERTRREAEALIEKIGTAA